MIMKFSNTSFKYDGRVNDEIWTSSGLRGIARTRIRPATRAIRFQYRAPFSLAAARAEWRNLASATQDEWSDFAALTFGWPLQGSPRYLSGEDFFANFYTVHLLLDEWAPVPDVPLAGPVWQTRPKFWEFATWESGVYTLKAETEFDVDTVLLFSGLPPSRVGFKPDFAREVIIGNEQLYSGLLPDDEFDSVHYMMENTFGTITDAQKIWGRVWEIQDGYIRTLKDPCTPDPTDTPPAEDTLNLEIYNDFNDYAFLILVYALADDYTMIGNAELYNIAPYETDEATIDIEEGYTRDDVEYLEFDVSWFGGDLMFAQEVYDDSDPFEFTIVPDI